MGTTIEKLTYLKNSKAAIKQALITQGQNPNDDLGTYGNDILAISRPKEEQSKTITAGTTQQTINPDSGKVLSSVVVNPTPSESKNITPSTSPQVINPTSGKFINQINVGAVTSTIDSNIIASNIKQGTTILGVVGTLQEGESEDELYSALNNEVFGNEVNE